MKEQILKILGNKYRNYINLKTFMLNDDGELKNLNFDYCIFLETRNFKLFAEYGEINLNTTISGQFITDEWLRELDDLLKIKFAIEKLL